MNAGARGPGPRTRAFVDWTLRNGRWIWLFALVLAVPATWRTASLYANLKSDLEQLLPRNAPSVRALDELRTRMPGLQYLGVIVDTGDAAGLAAGDRFIDDLATRIRAYPPNVARAVRTGSAEERVFLEKHAALYVDVADLRTIRDRIEARRDYEVAHETGGSLDDDAPPPLDFSDIERKYDARLHAHSSNEGDRYSSKDEHATLLLIEVGGFESGSSRGKELLARVKADVAALGGTDAYARGMRVGYAGDVAISVEELEALVQDLSLSSVLVILAVVLVLVLYYRWSRSVLVLVPPLLLATVYAFSIASLPPFGVDELNSNTAFLGSIIVGNGINFGIILLARYVEERRRGQDTREALVVAVGSARVGTLAAALAAGVSYVALVSTEFRGFRQFGIIGGIGMLLSWAVAFICMPPLIAWLDRSGSAARVSAAKPILARGLGGMVRRFRVPIVVVGAMVTVLAIAKVRSFGVNQLEYDTSKLRRADTWVRGEGYWGGRMDRVLGRYLTPIVLLADSPAQAQAIARRLRAESTNTALGPMISDIRTLEDVVPLAQVDKIAEAGAIREDMTPRMRSLIAPDKREQIDRLLGASDLQPITVDQVPRTFTTGLVERDGSMGRAVLVFPRASKALWEGPPLVSFVRALREVAATGGRVPARVAGALPLSSDILGSIQRDGTLASTLALLGVIGVVIAIFRFQSATVFVIASLTMGVLWMTAGSMVLDVKINFANFIAFPITFGIGVDYAVNVMSRYVQDGKQDIARVVRTTGSAVVLCSATTIIGYSSLLLAENRALFLFGVVAVLGEIACLTAAVTVLPAVLAVLERRRSAGRSSLTPGE